ncbi:MAG TPA: CsbD family protein [Nocardioides sp.]|nr:CsbD family protein [Nocardioides sp.]
MGLDDKAKHQATDVKGKVKEATGAATGNRSLKAEGKGDQGQAKAKEAGRHAKEAGKQAKNALKP